MEPHLFADEDLPALPTPADRQLQFSLAERTTYHFHQRCDRMTQELLSHCQWSIKTDTEVMTLAIACPDVTTYWNIISALPDIAKYLEAITNFARVIIHPPVRQGSSFTAELDEIPTDHNSNRL